jgi:acyl-CoA synthetase (AMP-forming)/AMP-acid ligase II
MSTAAVGTLLPDVLRDRARRQPTERAFVLLDVRGDEYATLTYGDLDARARAVAAALAGIAAPGDRALLMFDTGPDFLVAYAACLYTGVVAVPIVPPRAGSVRASTAAIVRDCAPVALLGISALLDAVTPDLVALGPGLHPLPVDLIAADAVDADAAAAFVPVPVGPDTLAFLQYTSGSTATPKGVMVTHGNLAANQEMIAAEFRHDPRQAWVGWAPLFHDQGLIGNVLHPLYIGALGVLMPPAAFVRRPLLWLSVISRYRAGSSGGPNFAFELCATHASRLGSPAAAGRAGAAGLDPDLDLSCWKVAFNGAEPIRADTLRRFAEAFAPYGLRPETLYPCYGLAEATLFVTGSEPGRGPRTLTADPDALSARRYRPASGPDARVLVGSGRVLPGGGVRIVDPDIGLPSPPDHIGEIWLHGPHITHGYWRRPDATAETFDATCPDDPDRRYLRTGDLGLIVDGELYVAGRLKDMIIIRGRNHYPQDIELTATSAHPAVRPGGAAAFTVPHPGGTIDDADMLVVVLELRATPGVDPDEAAEQIRAAVLREHDLSIGELVLTESGALDKTSSGKIMRAAARHRHLATGFPAWTPSLPPV